MVIAIVYISAFVQGWIGIVILATLALYLPVTFVLTEMRRGLKQELNNADNKKSFKATDAFLNYETIKYFNNEDFEVESFGDAVGAYQKTEARWMCMLYALNALQSLIMSSSKFFIVILVQCPSTSCSPHSYCVRYATSCLGLKLGLSTGVIAGVVLCVRGVVRQELTVGKFTLLLSLLRQLFAPLNYLGSYYRMIQNYATDMENMYDLLDTFPVIADAPKAQPLRVGAGAVEFEDVSFSYGTEREVLNKVSFGIHGGGTLGIVGSTGSGKSSLLRLLFRLYDTSHGCIKIDGQRIDEVTLVSIKINASISIVNLCKGHMFLPA